MDSPKDIVSAISSRAIGLWSCGTSANIRSRTERQLRTEGPVTVLASVWRECRVCRCGRHADQHGQEGSLSSKRRTDYKRTDCRSSTRCIGLYVGK